MINLYYWWKVLDSKQIPEFNKTCRSLFIKGVDHKANVTKTSYVKFIDEETLYNSKWHKQMKMMYELVQEANRLQFGFNIYPNRFSYKSRINYNIYDAKRKGEYDWHTDGNYASISDIKLTALINLSEKKYEGGDLKLIGAKNFSVPEMKPGNMIVFPSFVGHKVEPVTKGERISLALWFWGPPFI